jgi:Ca2+/H+ antiporter, TMEM165/GDT1 family
MLAVGAGAWARVVTTIVAAFLASLVECVEALTVVLAVGSVRGWRSALTGAVAALALLGALIAVLGRQLSRIPLHLIQTGVGAMILLFGLRWLRKAILRAAGRIPMHDEPAVFRENRAAMQHALSEKRGALDRIAFAATFHITMLEGTEVVFIVIALGAGSAGLLLPAIMGAVGALITVSTLGVALHRPLSRVPENTLKFAVGVLLSGFGTFWIGEGAGLWWPGGDVAIPALVAGYLGIACALVPACRQRAVPVEG